MKQICMEVGFTRRGSRAKCEVGWGQYHATPIENEVGCTRK